MRYLMEKMEELEKSVMEALSALPDKMTSMETKIESYRRDLTVVQAKVDLDLQSISLVQQEHVQVAKSLK
jgi:predicted  nucleic acid-binding Zn-ribbon protein